ncbi:MAG: acetate--CoA ligase family protein [Gemmatimonadota bacterium]
MKNIFRPSSVAVVGASRREGSIGYGLVHNLVSHGFTGRLYPVNPKARAVHAVPAYPSISSLPEAPELAVIAVPKEAVLETVRECGEKGVGGVIVISAGFREIGGEGVRRERELLGIVREYGMRMVGPNCMGALNTSPAVSMNATFAPTMPEHGNIAFMSQSGAMGVTILDYAAEYGVGINQFVSVGNKADVSGNDLLEYWSADEGVGVILMYLESFGDPRRFTSLARRTTRTKPVIAVKAGRTRAGARAASSHTGALAQVDIATDALFSQCGVLRVESVEELFDAATAFGNAPLPEGPRVAILTNAGGPGILIADACEGSGLEVRPLCAGTREALREGLPEEASVANPVDMIATASAEEFRRALGIVIEDDEVDAVIAAYVPVGLRAPIVARAIREAASDSGKPVLAVLMGKRGLPQGMAELREAAIPVYRFPESAAHALGAMWKYRQWQKRPPAAIRQFDDVDDARVEAVLDGVRRAGRDRLDPLESFEILSSYGIPVAPHGLATDVDSAAALAERIGFPVVLKAASDQIGHKTDIGAVELDVRDGAGVREAFERVARAARSVSEAAAAEGVLVQRMIEGGRETIVGTTVEPRFGPIVMFGLGGVYVEAVRDVAFRVQPVGTLDAEEMIRSIRGFGILAGVRGEEGVNLGRLADVVQRVSQLVGRHPAIGEMDINPLLAFPDPDGPVAVDARFRLVAERGERDT